MTEPIKPDSTVTVSFRAVYVQEIVSTIHVGRKRHLVLLDDGTRLLIPVGARLRVHDDAES